MDGYHFGLLEKDTINLKFEINKRTSPFERGSFRLVHDHFVALEVLALDRSDEVDAVDSR